MGAHYTTDRAASPSASNEQRASRFPFKTTQVRPSRRTGASTSGSRARTSTHCRSSTRGGHPLSNPHLEHSPQVRVRASSGGKRLTPSAGRRRGLEHAHTRRVIDREWDAGRPRPRFDSGSGTLALRTVCRELASVPRPVGLLSKHISRSFLVSRFGIGQ